MLNIGALNFSEFFGEKYALQFLRNFFCNLLKHRTVYPPTHVVCMQ
jgi:hypothetical protein